MSKKITKIDDDHYEFVTETKRVVSLIELEQELLELKEFNKRVLFAEKEIEKLSEEVKRNITCLGVMDITVLEAQIKELKSING